MGVAVDDAADHVDEGVFRRSATRSPRTNLAGPSSSRRSSIRPPAPCDRRRASTSSISPADRSGIDRHRLPAWHQAERAETSAIRSEPFVITTNFTSTRIAKTLIPITKLSPIDEAAEGLDDLAGGIGAGVPVAQDQPRRGEVERQPQHRRDGRRIVRERAELERACEMNITVNRMTTENDIDTARAEIEQASRHRQASGRRGSPRAERQQDVPAAAQPRAGSLQQVGPAGAAGTWPLRFALGAHPRLVRPSPRRRPRHRSHVPFRSGHRSLGLDASGPGRLRRFYCLSLCASVRIEIRRCFARGCDCPGVAQGHQDKVALHLRDGAPDRPLVGPGTAPPRRWHWPRSARSAMPIAACSAVWDRWWRCASSGAMRDRISRIALRPDSPPCVISRIAGAACSPARARCPAVVADQELHRLPRDPWRGIPVGVGLPCTRMVGPAAAIRPEACSAATRRTFPFLAFRSRFLFL